MGCVAFFHQAFKDGGTVKSIVDLRTLLDRLHINIKFISRGNVDIEFC